MNKQLSRFKHSEGLIMLKAKVIITYSLIDHCSSELKLNTFRLCWTLNLCDIHPLQ